MAKQVEIKIKATDEATNIISGVRSSLGQLDKEAKAAEIAASKAALRRADLGTFARFGEDLKRSKKFAESSGLAGESSILGLLLGGGAAVSASIIGQSLQKLPEAQNKFLLALKTGSTKTEAFAGAFADAVPVVGDLAKGFRSLADVVTGQAKALGEHDLEKAEREAESARRVALGQARDAIVRDRRLETTEAFRGNQLLRTPEAGQGLKAASLDFDRLQAKLALERSKRGTLTTDQQKLFDADESAQMRIALDRVKFEQEAEDRIRLEGYRKRQDAIFDLDNEASQARLRLAGEDALAEGDALVVAHKRALDLINRAEEEARRTGHGDEETNQRLIAAENSRFVVGQLAAEAAQREHLAAVEDRRFETSQNLLKAEQQRLSLGDAQDQQAAKELEITESIRARRQDLVKIIADINSTPGQRAQAFQEGLALDVQERLAKQLALTPTFHGSTAASNSSPFTTGQAEAAREKVVVDPKVLALMEELRKQNEKSADKIGEAVGKAMAAVFSKLPQLKGIFGLN